MSARRAIAALLGGSTLLLAGCGGSTPTAQTSSAPVSTLPSLEGPQVTAQPPGTTGAASESPAASVLPDLVVDDVGAGTKVNLASLAPSAQPILVWMWAPH